MRILLVEDEPRLAASIVRGLMAEGFSVDHADTGTDGLWRAREGTYAAIILDIMLPGTNGYEICRTLRDEGDPTPIMMLTAKDGEYDEAEGFDTGADDWVTKPFSFVALVARLRALIRRAGGGRTAQPRLCVDDLELDPATRTCSRASHPIELTAREFDIVELLLRGGGEVVTRQRLLDEVWGLDFEGDPNVLDVYIGYVRKKIDKPFDRQSIKTVRGIGYRLVPS